MLQRLKEAVIVQVRVKLGTVIHSPDTPNIILLLPSPDWVLDKTKGIDYPLGLRHTELLEHDIKKQILGVHGVREIKEFSMHQENQCIKVQADVVTDYGKTGILTTLNK